jgi:hypothetical protein
MYDCGRDTAGTGHLVDGGTAKRNSQRAGEVFVYIMLILRLWRRGIRVKVDFGLRQQLVTNL